MSLQTRLTALAQAVGADMKALLRGPFDYVQPSGDYALTAAMTAIPGMSIVIAASATYKLGCTLDITTFGGGQLVVGQVFVNGVAPVAPQLVHQPSASADFREAVSQNWKLPLIAGDVVTLRAARGASGNAANISSVHSNFWAHTSGQGPQGPAGPTGPGGSILVSDEGGLLPVRAKLNIVGPNIAATDDVANDRITVTTKAGVIPIPGVWTSFAPYYSAGVTVGNSNLEFKKFPDGRVMLRGRVYLAANGGQVGVLPAGYVPPYPNNALWRYAIPAEASSGGQNGFARCYIAPGGNMWIDGNTAAGNVYYDLSGIQFDTDSVTQMAVSYP